MTIFKRIFGFALVCCLCLPLAACSNTTASISNHLQNNLNRLSGLLERIEETSEPDLSYEKWSEQNQSVAEINASETIIPDEQNNMLPFGMRVQKISEETGKICTEIHSLKDNVRSQISSLRQVQHQMESGETKLNDAQFHICKDALSSLTESCNKLSLSRSEVKNAAKTLRRAANQTHGVDNLKAKYVHLINSLETRRRNYQNASNLLDILMNTLAQNGMENTNPGEPLTFAERTSQNTGDNSVPNNTYLDNNQNNTINTLPNRSVKQNRTERQNTPGFNRRPFNRPSDRVQNRQDRQPNTMKEPYYKEPVTRNYPDIQPNRIPQQPKPNNTIQRNVPSAFKSNRNISPARNDAPNTMSGSLPNNENLNTIGNYAENANKENNTIVDNQNFYDSTQPIQNERDLSMPNQNKLSEQTNLEMEYYASAIQKPAQERKVYQASPEEIMVPVA